SLPNQFKQDCMQLVKRAKVILISYSYITFSPFPDTRRSYLMLTVHRCLLGFSIRWLLLRVRYVHWFWYNVDCNKIGDVLAKNPIVHKITGLVLTYLLTFLVLEADIPWYTSLDYGPSFNEWTEDDFRSAINSVIQALPNTKFVTIVSDWCA